MQLLTIAQIRAMEVDDVIPGLSGTLTSVFKSKSGGEGKKAWKVQNLEITQGKDVMRVCVWNRADDIPDGWKGKKITVLSTDQDSGITGVFAADNDYKNKITREIKVQANHGGEIALGGSGSAGANEDGAGQAPNRAATADRAAQHAEDNAQPPRAVAPSKPAINPFAAGVFGGTVGHAEKLTFDALEKLDVEMFLDENTVNPRWLKMFWIGSSAIIRVSRTLEDGKLAPKPEVAPIEQTKQPVATAKTAAALPKEPLAGDEPLEQDEVPM